MFEESYKAQKLTRNLDDDGFLMYTDRYIFKTRKGTKYVVLIESYRFDIFIIKFFPSKLENDQKKRYSVLLGDYDAPRVISTCIKLLLEILKKHHDASFGFIGNPIHLVEANYNNTKRFKVYARICTSLFGESTFEHYTDAEQSTYLFVNKKKGDCKKFAEQAKTMFKNYYPALFPNATTFQISSVG